MKAGEEMALSSESVGITCKLSSLTLKKAGVELDNFSHSYGGVSSFSLYVLLVSFRTNSFLKEGLYYKITPEHLCKEMKTLYFPKAVVES